MRRLALIFWLLGCFASSAGASPPALAAIPDRVDLGTITQAGAKGAFVIKLRNGWRDRISIKHVVTTCGCVTARSLNGQVIEPGETIEVSLSYDMGVTEPASKTVNVLVAPAGSAPPLLIPVTYRYSPRVILSAPTLKIQRRGP